MEKKPVSAWRVIARFGICFALYAVVGWTAPNATVQTNWRGSASIAEKKPHVVTRPTEQRDAKAAIRGVGLILAWLLFKVKKYISEESRARVSKISFWGGLLSFVLSCIFFEEFFGILSLLLPIVGILCAISWRWRILNGMEIVFEIALWSLLYP